MTRSDALAHVESLERGAVPNNAKVDADLQQVCLLQTCRGRRRNQFYGLNCQRATQAPETKTQFACKWILG